MDVESRRLTAARVEAGIAHGTRRGPRRSRGKAGVLMLLVPALAGLVLAGCGSMGQASYSADPTSAQNEDGAEANEGDAVGTVRDVTFEELAADPAAFVGSRIRVTGSVFFHAVCPPPGATAGPCVLLGYLADPAQRAFTAADEPRAIALAEGGVRVACEETAASTRACPGWSADSTYTLEGLLAHQVLGGKETELVQLEVEAKGAAQPW